MSTVRLHRGLCLNFLSITCRLREVFQHFISECPDRSKPPDGYICKICSKVRILLITLEFSTDRSSSSLVT